MFARQPSSTLFPYTTLFRSEVAQYAEGRRITSYFPLGETHDGTAVKPTWLWTTVEHGMQDRKSTRLNSSHVSSSYAVFCLKKKRVNVVRSDSWRSATRRQAS